MTNRSYSFTTSPMTEVNQENFDLIMNAPTMPPLNQTVNQRQARIFPSGRIETSESVRSFYGPEDRHGSISTMERRFAPGTGEEIKALIADLVEHRFDITWIGDSW